MASQIGSEAIEDGTRDVSGRSWDVYDVDGDAGRARAYVRDDDGFSLIVAILAPPSDLDEVERQLIDTVLGKPERM